MEIRGWGSSKANEAQRDAGSSIFLNELLGLLRTNILLGLSRMQGNEQFENYWMSKPQ